MWIVYPTLTFVALPPLAVVCALLFAIGFVVGAYDPFEVMIEESGLRAALLLFAFGNVALAAFAIASRPARGL